MGSGFLVETLVDLGVQHHVVKFVLPFVGFTSMFPTAIFDIFLLSQGYIDSCNLLLYAFFTLWCVLH